MSLELFETFIETEMYLSRYKHPDWELISNQKESITFEERSDVLIQYHYESDLTEQLQTALHLYSICVVKRTKGDDLQYEVFLPTNESNTVLTFECKEDTIYYLCRSQYEDTWEAFIPNGLEKVVRETKTHVLTLLKELPRFRLLEATGQLRILDFS